MGLLKALGAMIFIWARRCRCDINAVAAWISPTKMILRKYGYIEYYRAGYFWSNIICNLLYRNMAFVHVNCVCA